MEYTNKRFCLEVTGDYACFTRPEMKAERVSYDVITPSAARAIFQAVFWKPAIRWQVRRIEVLQPIRWVSVRRNEIGRKMSPSASHLYREDAVQQRAGLFLRDVGYRLHADLVFIPPRERPEEKSASIRLPEDATEKELFRKDENPGKYHAIFERRARRGQSFTTPYLGCREFSVRRFRLVEDGAVTDLEKPIEETRDLGYMLYDLDFNADPAAPPALFFRARMDRGVIEVPEPDSKEVLR